LAEHKPRGSLREPLTRALLALTLGTGLIDAVSYLGLGRVFSANMTGNVVLLGFGIAGTGGLPVLAPVIAAAAFLTGAVIGTRLIRARSAEAELTAALALEIVLLVIAAALAAAIDVHPDGASGRAPERGAAAWGVEPPKVNCESGRAPQARWVCSETSDIGAGDA
jgi:hypothetical protein